MCGTLYLRGRANAFFCPLHASPRQVASWRRWEDEAQEEARASASGDVKVMQEKASRWVGWAPGSNVRNAARGTQRARCQRAS